MKARLMLVLCAALPLAACAGDYGYYGPAAGSYYDGFYDDYYGQIYDGYWGPNDVFFYRSSPHGHFIRDRGHHFRHDMGGQPMGHYHAMHGEFHGGPHGGHGDHHH